MGNKVHALETERAVPTVILSGRPERNTAINSDDICNLVIALNTTTDVNQFLGVVK